MYNLTAEESDHDTMYGGSPVRDKAFTYLDTITTKRIMSSQRAHDRRS